MNRELLKSRNINVQIIIFLGKSPSLIASVDSILGRLKKLCDLETKNICFIPAGIENLGPYIKRLCS